MAYNEIVMLDDGAPEGDTPSQPTEGGEGEGANPSAGGEEMAGN